MKKLAKTIIIILILLIIPLTAIADTIYLKDGTVIKGDILNITETTVVIKTDEGILEIDKNDIVRIEFDPKEVEEESEEESDEETREDIEEILEELLEDEENTIIIIIKPKDKDEDEDENENIEEDEEENDYDEDDYNEDDMENNNENENIEEDEDDYEENEEEENDWNNEYDWDNDEGGDHHYVSTMGDLVLSVGFVSVVDFFYNFNTPYYVWGISVRVMDSLGVPLSFNFSFNMANNVLVNYNVGTTEYTLLAEYWCIYSLGAEFRFLPHLLLNPFVGANISFHHLMMPFSSISNHYGAFAFTLTGGIEIFIVRELSVQLYLRKHFPIGLDASFGLYYDPAFYEALFSNIQFGFTVYLNFEI